MIYTFYSFKGGVGRSMALASVAELLVRRGLRVLMVDFDLEAPGLERYFADAGGGFDMEQALDHPGLIDLLHSYRELREFAGPAAPPALRQEPALEERIAQLPVEPLERFIVPVYKASATSGGSLAMITAGRRAGEQFKEYAHNVLSFPWEEFFQRDDGELFFEWFRREVQRDVDVVLLDSRTGVTEMGGVCTYLLADAVISFVASNQQNLEGSGRISDSLARRDLIEKGRCGRPLQQLIVPSRMEINENTQVVIFRTAFQARFQSILAADARWHDKDPFTELQIPYIPYYSFGERLAVRHPEDPFAHLLAKPLETLSAVIAGMAPPESRLFQAYSDPTQYWVKTAEQVVAGLAPDELENVRRILTRVVAVGRPAEKIADARIRVAVRDFDEDLIPSLNRLIATPVLTRAAEERPDGSKSEFVELSEQSLVSSWPRLKRWIDEDREFLTWRQQMAISLEKWEKSQQSSDLLAGTLLSQGLDSLARRPQYLNQREARFIRNSKQFEEQNTLQTNRLSASVKELESSVRSAQARTSRLVWRFFLPMGGLALLVAATLLMYFSEPIRTKAAIAIGHYPKDYFSGSTTSWTDDIRLDNTGKLERADLWHVPPEWVGVPGVGSDPHDGALLIRGTTPGSPNIDPAALYDFTARFDISILMGSSAAWILRAQKDGKTGYLFELDQHPPVGLTLRASMPFGKGGEQQINLPCCAAGDVYRITATARGYTFTHTISLILSQGGSSSALSEPITKEFSDASESFRYGNIAFLANNPGNIAKLEYLYVQPHIVQ